MKTSTRFLLLAVLVSSLSSCLFKEPVYSGGFLKIDAALGGVWVAEPKDGDLRKLEFAVVAPLDEDRYVVHHPSREKDGIYYEGRLLKVRERSLMQLRLLATFDGGLPKADAERYTLLWIEKDPKGPVRVRSMGGEGVKGKGPAEVKQLLDNSAVDWSSLFGEPMVFRLLKDN
jgi:hypothetical protein